MPEPPEERRAKPSQARIGAGAEPEPETQPETQPAEPEHGARVEEPEPAQQEPGWSTTS